MTKIMKKTLNQPWVAKKWQAVMNTENNWIEKKTLCGISVDIKDEVEKYEQNSWKKSP